MFNMNKIWVWNEASNPRPLGCGHLFVCLTLDLGMNEALYVFLIYKTRVWNEASDPRHFSRGHLFVVNYCFIPLS